jgi:4-amino-4-deoxy-L-arabinose transferase-like glycosyltransferase
MFKDASLEKSESRIGDGAQRAVTGDFAIEASSSRDLSRWVLLLVVVTTALRLAFAYLLSLTIDEQYMVAAGRQIQFGYFDHPPAAWWLSWAASHLSGSEAPLVVRSPFVLLFGLSTWLMYRLGALLFSESAGLWACMLMNLSPVFGIAAAIWVVPDGPLTCALLAGALCLVHALFGRSSSVIAWWGGAGVWAGLALFSKYTAVLTMAGVAVYLVTQADQRRWLRRPEPYIAVVLAVLVFSPVLIWNAEHNWVSFIFQARRTLPIYGPPIWAPLELLGGEALFLLPHLWLGLVVALAAAVRGGWRNSKSWMMACFALPPILFFACVSVWTPHVLYHWASPGYLMAMPLLGSMLGSAQPIWRERAMRAAAWTAAFVLLVSAGYVIEVRLNLAPEAFRKEASRVDPNVESGDWSSLKATFGDRGYLARSNLVVGATDWRMAGKLDYALGGALKVVGLGGDVREYLLTGGGFPSTGVDVLIPMLDYHEPIMRRIASEFAQVEVLAPAPVFHAGQTIVWLKLLLCHGYHGGPRLS